MDDHSRRRRRTRPGYSDEERVAQYLYLVTILPGTVIERAHSAAFGELSPAQRQEVIDALGPLLPDDVRDEPYDDPRSLARVVTSAERRDAILRADIGGAVAARFVVSGAVVSYFTVGTGSLTIEDRPPWVAELAAHEFASIDAGRQRTGRTDAGMAAGLG